MKLLIQPTFSILRWTTVVAVCLAAYAANASDSKLAESEVVDAPATEAKVAASTASEEEAKDLETMPKTAHGVVEMVTADMLKVIREKHSSADEDPKVFYDAVQAILDPVVDFEYIARNVMGSYGKGADAALRKEFSKAFKTGLVATYARGMASFGDLDIKVLPPKGSVGGQRRVSVVQEVRNGDGVNRVSYTMRLNREGQWKLVNVLLDGINLGQAFRSQFAQAVQKNDGDLAKVIASWASEV